MPWPMKAPSNKNYPKHFGFLLVHDFTLISLSSAIEPLRMANRICDSDIYSWKTMSETGEPVSASDGLRVNVDCSIRDKDLLEEMDAIIVCGGWHIGESTNSQIVKWLKVMNQNRLGLGAVCTGSYILAKAGLLDGYRCSIHWENMSALADLFPDVRVTSTIFSIDRNRYTSSGGTTPVDMMLHFILEQCGVEVSAGVAEQFIFDRIRRSDDQQRVPLKHAIGFQSTKLVVAVELMEANVRELISQEELASYVGLSRRQLQRLFKRYLFCTPSRYYLQIRLQRARELLRQTGMSLVEVAALTGFVSTSHFSKSYKEHYSYPPSTERLVDATRSQSA